MSERKKAAAQNSIIGLVGQLCSLILQMISRKIFIAYIGEELLGLSGTFTSLLSTLSLAELGIQSSISFNLYKPLHDKKFDEVNTILNVYKIMYRFVGYFFIVMSFVLLPLLGFFVKDIELTSDIYIFFLLQAATSACTYFLAYKRTLLYADQKEFVYKIVDTIMIVIFKSAQIISIMYFKNFYIYLILQLIQVYVGNIIVNVICNKKYNYLKKVKFNKSYAKQVMGNAKDIYANRIAGYVYSSADDLIISKILGTVKVAYIGNYTSITTNIKYLLHSILLPIIPIMANYLADDRDAEQQKTKLATFRHLSFLLSMCVLIPTCVLIDDFVIKWVGERFAMPWTIKFLIIADIFVYILNIACANYINGKGLFKQDKFAVIAGTVINLGLSFILIFPLGISGILLATVSGQIIIAIGRSYIIFINYFNNDKKGYRNYLLKSFFYIFQFYFISIICIIIYNKMIFDNFIVKFIVGGILSEIIIVIIYLILNFKTKEFTELVKIIKPYILKVLKRGKQ